MKYTDITLESLLSAIRHQWKKFIAVLLAFSVFGGLSGVVYANRLAAEAKSSATELQNVDFSTVERNEGYYQMYWRSIAVRCDDISRYLEALSAETILNDDQKEEVLALQLELSSFEEGIWTQIRERFSVSDSLYVPIELLDEQAMRYTALCHDNELSMLESKAIADVLTQKSFADEEISIIDTVLLRAIEEDNESKNHFKTQVQKALDITAEPEKTENTLEQWVQAVSQYGLCVKRQQVFESILKQLETEYDVVKMKIEQMDVLLEQARMQINGLAVEVNNTARSIASSNHLEIQSTRLGDDSMAFTIRHTHMESTARDAFAILFLIGVLSGICCGAFYCIYHEGKRKHQKPKC